MWRALASGHRRAILDLLRDGPRTTGEVAAALPHLSRYAVMQHLGVLEDAGLVLVRREGRQRFNHLNAVPLREAYERWVSRFADRQAEGLLALRRHVETKGEHTMDQRDASARAVRIENEIRLKAPRERVFAAMTTEQQAWYPHSYGGARLQRIVFEERVGGLCYEDWGDGMGHVYGVVAHYDAPRAVCLRGFLGNAVTLEQWAILEEDGDETVLKHRTVAFGELSDDDVKGIRFHGDLVNTEAQLRAWVERGERVSAG